MQLSRVHIVVVSVLGGFLPSTLSAAQPASELEALRAEVAALKENLAQKDATISQLEAEKNTAASNAFSAENIPMAMASSSRAFKDPKNKTPSSTLDWDNAVRAAAAARLMVSGSSLLTVMPTGSMEPVFNERAILLTEKASFDDLRIGDIVTYAHPQYGVPVVHRILEKHGDKFWSKGDANGQMDEVYITRQNFKARVFGIIYAKEPSKGPGSIRAALARK